MPWSQPSFGKLGQAAWQSSKLAVVDVFIAPKNTPYDHPTLWTFVGRISPGTFKNDFTEQFFDVKTGIPETVKESFVTVNDAKLEFELMEMTGLGYALASGGIGRVCMYDGSNSTTVPIAPLNKTTIESVEVTAVGTLAVGDELEIGYTDGTKDYTFITGAPAAEKAAPAAPARRE